MLHKRERTVIPLTVPLCYWHQYHCRHKTSFHDDSLPDTFPMSFDVSSKTHEAERLVRLACAVSQSSSRGSCIGDACTITVRGGPSEHLARSLPTLECHSTSHRTSTTSDERPKHIQKKNFFYITAAPKTPSFPR